MFYKYKFVSENMFECVLWVYKIYVFILKFIYNM